jgi:rfaE bifunctional protein nucleotidyltransferase chain/domain
MNKNSKNLDDLSSIRKKFLDKKIVLAHGVFDVFHIGHLRHLKISKSEGDILVVSITSDSFVNKGPSRPHFKENFRAEILSSIKEVDFVYINHAETPINVIKALKPNIYIKGKDYKDLNKDITKNILKEKKEVEKNNGKLIFSDDITHSSSHLINKHFSLDKKKRNQSNISFENINKIFKKIKNIKTLVLGELILDEYIFTEYLGAASKEEITVMNYKNKKTYLGGAFPIAKNISEFCGEVTYLSCGKIEKKELNFLRSQSKACKIKLNFFEDNYRLIKKTRYLTNKNRKLFEIYYQSTKNKKQNNEKFFNFLKKNLHKFDLVIAADFGHGLFDERVINLLTKKSKFLSVNTQTNAENRGYNLITKYGSADHVTLDLPEIQLALKKKDHEKELIKNMFKEIKIKNLTLTLASKGLIVNKKIKNKIASYSIDALSDNAVDTIGAGDAVFAFTSLMSKMNSTIEENAFVSNLAGALKIQILGHESHIKKVNFIKSLTYLLK